MPSDCPGLSLRTPAAIPAVHEAEPRTSQRTVRPFRDSPYSVFVLKYLLSPLQAPADQAGHDYHSCQDTQGLGDSEELAEETNGQQRRDGHSRC
jgi:hypothetical protein